MKANERQVGGAHYANDYQHWDFTADVLKGRYMEGQITKYVSRWRKKNGVQDLQKALHFLDKLDEQRAQGVATPIYERGLNESASELLAKFGSGLGTIEWLVVEVITKWKNKDDLNYARRLINTLITGLEGER